MPTETLDGVVTEHACIMKLDVEGYEPQARDVGRYTEIWRDIGRCVGIMKLDVEGYEPQARDAGRCREI